MSSVNSSIKKRSAYTSEHQNVRRKADSNSPFAERISDSSLPPMEVPTIQRQSSDLIVHDLEHTESEPSYSNARPAIVVSQLEQGTRPEQVAPDASSTNRFGSHSPHRTEDPPTLNRYNFGVEQLATHSNQYVSPEDESVIPESITYSLHITFEKQEVPKTPSYTKLQSIDSSHYRNIDMDAEACVKEHFGDSLAGRSLNFRDGDCTIIDVNGDKQVHGLSSHDDWADICIILLNLCRSNRNHRYHLDIRRDYFGLLTRRISDESFASLKRREISKLMRKAFDGRRYIPRTDLMRLTSTDMVRQILNEDPIPLIEPSQATKFGEDVLRKGRKLLAMCVHAQLHMACLKMLMDRGHNDNSVSVRPLRDNECCHEKCEANFWNLIQSQGGFNAAEYSDPGQHQELSPSTVVPIHYHLHNSLDSPLMETIRTNSKAQDEFRGISDDNAQEKACCGSGAYSNVYRVQIDPAHHRLSKNRNVVFAMKVFKDRPLHTGDDFNKELQFLGELRKFSYDHIVTHFATWTHDGRYYMLFPYALCNMRTYMERMTFGDPHKKNILWLLDQMHGLASALKSIHNLSDSRNQAGSSATLAAPTPGQRKAGWHHDLKPENILYFITSTPSGGEFHIADFGSGKVHTYRSGSINTSSLSGTPTYEPPESEGTTSRPYDVWSMGCVFLELMIWAIFDYKTVQSFTSERMDRRFPNSQTRVVRDDAYWQMNEYGDVALRQPVVERIEALKDRLEQQKLQSLNEVLELVRRMLDTDRNTRITALDLSDTISRIYEQFKIDMERFGKDSLPQDIGFDDQRSSPPLPRYSTNPPDRRTPEPIGLAATHASGPSFLYTSYPDPNHLTASPLSTSSTGGHWRNSANSESALSPRPRTVSDSSIRVQQGSPRPSEAHTPDPTPEGG